jgi:hypothetical protein
VYLLAVPKFRVAGAILFRYGCFLAMLGMTLATESRPAPSLPDAVLEWVPYVPWVERYNYILWVGAYVSVTLALGWRDIERFARYMISAGLLALIRGLCIMATGLGPVHGRDLNAGMDAETRWRGFWDIVFMRGVLTENTPQLYLTKDLFFSGHVSTTFLLLLYVWKYPRLRLAALTGHGLVVLAVFFGHLHYTIDVVGAYAVAFSLFVLREADVARSLRGGT